MRCHAYFLKTKKPAARNIMPAIGVIEAMIAVLSPLPVVIVDGAVVAIGGSMPVCGARLVPVRVWVMRREYNVG